MDESTLKRLLTANFTYLSELILLKLKLVKLE